jgi:hypothetical protein
MKTTTEFDWLDVGAEWRLLDPDIAAFKKPNCGL